MSRRGVWQLRRLLVHYCDQGGSSRGTREFVETMMPQFAADNPQLAVEAAVRRGQHPGLLAEYLNKTTRHVDTKNAPAEEVLRQAVYLRSSLGRKASLQVKQRTRSSTPSIQGAWSHEVQEALKAQA
ncbi:54S ribosomal mitochondrial [Micractinium conductrix]|uniref:Large ribosomal subunit protein mL43 n=1 Tax=Micractinium conductrix TaxID=554055 RepID=A0A2P6UZV5_9CHLO|nr:54S ribosomal mitochondrial [Micractinium conductrix]|eukprot:PSC67376.1 54S ribosomal mitochondrial [Micractinium conductrix]